MGYDEPRLTAAMWVSAHIRRCMSVGIPAVLVQRGDDQAGTVLIKWNRFSGGCQVLTPTRDSDGRRIWIRGTGEDAVDEQTADAYVARQLKNDPDLWVLEIEDFDGRYELGEPIR